jgi:hypothetical protein
MKWMQQSIMLEAEFTTAIFFKLAQVRLGRNFSRKNGQYEKKSIECFKSFVLCQVFSTTCCFTNLPFCQHHEKYMMTDADLAEG